MFRELSIGESLFHFLIYFRYRLYCTFMLVISIFVSYWGLQKKKRTDVHGWINLTRGAQGKNHNHQLPLTPCLKKLKELEPYHFSRKKKLFYV